MLPIGSWCRRQCHCRVNFDVGVIEVVEVGGAETPKAQRVCPEASKGHRAVAQDAPLGRILGEQPSQLEQDWPPPWQDPATKGVVVAAQVAEFNSGSSSYTRGPVGGRHGGCSSAQNSLTTGRCTTRGLENIQRGSKTCLK